MRVLALVLVLALASPVAAQCHCPCDESTGQPSSPDRWVFLGGGALAIVFGVVMGVASLVILASTPTVVIEDAP